MHSQTLPGNQRGLIIPNAAVYEFATLTAQMVYTVITTSQDSEPAVLHKLRENCKERWNANNPGVSWQDMKRTFRIYLPFVHNWEVNSYWLLAHIHKGSEFIIISPVTPANIFRKEQKHKYSAFAREIATLMNVGYEVVGCQFKYGGTVIRLAPTRTKFELLKVSIVDCKADPDDCRKGMKRYTASFLRYLKARLTIYTPLPQSRIEIHAEARNDRIPFKIKIHPYSFFSENKIQENPIKEKNKYYKP